MGPRVIKAVTFGENLKWTMLEGREFQLDNLKRTLTSAVYYHQMNYKISFFFFPVHEEQKIGATFFFYIFNLIT
jgi:hypothetical protein